MRRLTRAGEFLLVVCVLYNPFDIEAIRAKAVEEHPDIPKGDYLIHVGRVAWQKYHDILFQGDYLGSAKMHKPLPLVLL